MYKSRKVKKVSITITKGFLWKNWLVVMFICCPFSKLFMTKNWKTSSYFMFIYHLFLLISCSCYIYTSLLPKSKYIKHYYCHPLWPNSLLYLPSILSQTHSSFRHLTILILFISHNLISIPWIYLLIQFNTNGKIVVPYTKDPI